MVDYEDVWKGSWNDTTKYGPVCRHRRRIVRKLVRTVPHATILDLGCGDGSLLGELAAETDARLFGSDVSREAIELAKRNLPQAEFMQIDLNDRIPLEEVFDVVILSEVLEHVEHDEDALRQVAGMARHVVISVPGGPPDKVDVQFGHHRNYHDRTLPQRMEGCGFEVLRYFRWGMPMYEIMLALSRLSKNQAELSGGPFSPTKKALARAGYYLFGLSLPMGSQVFALGRSKKVG